MPGAAFVIAYLFESKGDISEQQVMRVREMEQIGLTRLVGRLFGIYSVADTCNTSLLKKHMLLNITSFKSAAL